MAHGKVCIFSWYLNSLGDNFGEILIPLQWLSPLVKIKSSGAQFQDTETI